jgi:hypothetical protein
MNSDFVTLSITDLADFVFTLSRLLILGQVYFILIYLNKSNLELEENLPAQYKLSSQVLHNTQSHSKLQVARHVTIVETFLILIRFSSRRFTRAIEFFRTTAIITISSVILHTDKVIIHQLVY